MTVDSHINKVQYEGNGAAAVFPIPFQFLDNADIKVLRTDNRQADEWLTTEFGVRRVGEAANLLYPIDSSNAPLPEGWKLTIIRSLPLTQETDLENGDPFNADMLEQSFDRLAMQIQQVAEEVDRAVKVPLSGAESGDMLRDELFAVRDDARLSAASSSSFAAASSDSAVQAATSAAEAKDSAFDANVSAVDAAARAADAAAYMREAEARGEEYVALAKAWAENPENEAVMAESYSAYHWAEKARKNAAAGETLATVNGLKPDADKNLQLVRAVTQAGYNTLKAEDLLAPGAEYVITDFPRLMFIGADKTERRIDFGGAIPGEIRLLPFRVAELPKGWYFANGARFALASAQGQALNALPAGMKADFGISLAGSAPNQTISVPNMFHGDGRGYFMRPATAPGGVVGDAIRNITGFVGTAGCNTGRAWSLYTPGRSNGVFSDRVLSPSQTTAQGATSNTNQYEGFGGTDFNIAWQVPTANENRPLYRNFTPAVYLGV